MVVCSDLHLRLDIPRCRGESQEDWIKHQFDRLMEIIDYANITKDDVCVAGDIFHRAGNPEYLTNLLVKAVGKLKGNFYIMPGNHDLRYREDHVKSSYNLMQSLVAFGKVCNLHEEFAVVHYGEEEPVGDVRSEHLFLHTLTFEKEKDVPYGVQHYETADSLLKKYPGYKYIIVGDQHRAFHVTKKDRHVINCGSMTTQSMNEVGYPHSFFHLTSEEDVKQISFKTPITLVADRFLKQEKDSEGRIVAMVEQLANYKGQSLDFIKSLELRLTSSDLSVKVKSIGNRWIEEVQNESN